MMTVYEVFDNDFHGDHGYFCRNLEEAKAQFSGAVTGHIVKIVIPTPITKDTVIALLNQESYAAKYERIIERK